MPAITVRGRKLSSLVGRELSTEEVAELIATIGISVEEVVGDEIKAEYNPNRPDFASHVGIARTLKGLLGTEVGLYRVKARKSGWRVLVDPSVKRVRPYVVGAVVKGLKFSEDDLVELIAVQEDLHWVLGRNRRKVAIGIHDLAKVKPPVRYVARPLEDVRFVPLHGTFPMSCLEVLEKLPTGRAYGHLVRHSGLAPLILDGRGEVMSFPPVINSSLTEVTTSTSDVFIDVTGTDVDAINGALNVLVSHLNDLGGRVHTIEVVEGRRRFTSPDLSVREWHIDLATIEESLGVALSSREVVDALRRMRFGAAPSRGKIVVKVPPHRTDILHPVDFAEEVAIAVWSRLEPEVPKTHGFGSVHRRSRVEEVLRSLMIGLGFTEVVNTVLLNSVNLTRFLPPDSPGPVRLLNPASVEYNSLRTTLIPGLLGNLALNKHNPFPQRLFEIGDVVLYDESKPELTRRALKMACVTSHSQASYTEIKSVYEEVSRFLKINLVPVEKDYPFLVEGRSVALTTDGAEVGLAGEVHPAVLEESGVEMPTAVMELDVESIGPFKVSG
ncbi:MAG: phenylalanine--tRNA ligase subunit beta [Thaumarchaeota archaeon]|nr:phenylalanine--tRNA ligase subunit beta [Candidatus Calditenuaceae archaeon]MDW8041736.1 phenylalanine--tRNA ligase subunit beta [Nitrososphaerota archaeon]